MAEFDDDFYVEAPEPECTVVFCDTPGTKMIQAFGATAPQLYCDDHAELAEANLEAEMEGDPGDGVSSRLSTD